MLRFLDVRKSATNVKLHTLFYFLLTRNQITQSTVTNRTKTGIVQLYLFYIYGHLKLRVSEMQLNTEFKKKKKKTLNNKIIKLLNKSAKIHNLKSNDLELSRYNNSHYIFILY